MTSAIEKELQKICAENAPESKKRVKKGSSKKAAANVIAKKKKEIDNQNETDEKNT